MAEVSQSDGSPALPDADHDSASSKKHVEDDTKTPVEETAEMDQKPTSSLEKISQSHPDFASNLLTFLKKLAPWQGIMPPALAKDMKDIENVAQSLNSIKKAPVSQWSCQVAKISMKQYARDIWHHKGSVPPAIQAYYASSDTYSSTIKYEDRGGVMADLSNDRPLPERVQINSHVILSELKAIISIPVLAYPILIPPPYKVLLQAQPGVRRRLGELREELSALGSCSNGAEKAKSLPLSDVTSKTLKDDLKAPESSEDTKSRETETKLDDQSGANETQEEKRLRLSTNISQLECLDDFVRTELKDVIGLRGSIESGTLESIAFSDLWHLFKPGDTVISTENGYEQLYTVYSITGGQIQTRARTFQEVQLHDSRGRGLDPEELVEDALEKLLRNEAYGIGSWTPLRIDCYYMCFDGAKIGPIRVLNRIKHYAGQRRVTELPVYPAHYHSDGDLLLKRMEERGRKYLSSTGHQSYDGLSVPSDSLSPSAQRIRPISLKQYFEFQEDIQGDVFVDFTQFYQDTPSQKPRLGSLPKSLPDTIESGESFPESKFYRPLSGHEIDVKLFNNFMTVNRSNLELVKPERALERADYLRLLPHAVPGYSFQARKWFYLDVDLVKPIDQWYTARDSSFQDLVIPERFRTLLVGLVENHASRLQRQQAKRKNLGETPRNTHIQFDLVRGKGQGLIILLHGPPGSGKTSTAETIAAYTQRPLYSITCGDLGLRADEAEDNLEEHMKKADKWGCVLLLDEADVFLMQRNWQNMERNALVSIFLRQLEYYSGILFLTTNRPGVLDEAFLSRIHISLKYPTIDLESTKVMWNNIMNKVERDNETSEIKVTFDRESLLDFAEKHYRRGQRTGKTWNGRQIRNAFQTALGLSHYQRLSMLRKKGIAPEDAVTSGKKRLMEVKLTKANFRSIAQTSREFEDYIRSLRGNDSDIAREMEVRDDYYENDATVAGKDYRMLPQGGRADSYEPKPLQTRSGSFKGKQVHHGKSRQRESKNHDDEDDDDSNESEEDDTDDDDLSE